MGFFLFHILGYFNVLWRRNALRLHKTLLPTRIFFHIIFSPQKSNIFKIQDLLAGLFLATDALIFRVIHYAFSNQIWKKAHPHTTQGAGRYQTNSPPTKSITPKIPIFFNLCIRGKKSCKATTSI